MFIGRRLSGRHPTLPLTSVSARAEDELVYVMENGKAFMMRIDGDIFDLPFASFTEWSSEEDRKAFDKLWQVAVTG